MKHTQQKILVQWVICQPDHQNAFDKLRRVQVSAIKDFNFFSLAFFCVLKQPKLLKFVLFQSNEKGILKEVK